MSTSYRLTIRRKSDKEQIGCSYVDCVKNILEYDSCAFIMGQWVGIEVLETLLERDREQLDSVTNNIYKMEDNIYKCSCVDVMHEIEDKVEILKCKRSSLRYAFEGAVRLLGVLQCMTEDMVIEKDGKRVLASEYWSTRDKDGDVHYVWVDSIEFKIEAEC